MINSIKTVMIGLILTLSCAGCVEVERSAGMVLDNANSVAKTARESLWQDPEGTPTPIADADEAPGRVDTYNKDSGRYEPNEARNDPIDRY